MMSIRLRFAIVAVLAVTASPGAFGGWELTLGPAWRSRVKSRVTGGIQATPVPASFAVTYDVNVPTVGAWTGAEPNIATVTDPLAPPLTLYAATATRTETTVLPGTAFGALESSDTDAPMGIKGDATFNFYEEGCFLIGINFRFAAYWGLRSSVYGSAGGGMTTVSTFTDYYLFSSGPFPVTPPGAGWALFLPDTTPYLPYRTPTGTATTPLPASTIRARVTSDLYQMGVGPRMSYRALEWIEAYAGAEALCNIVAMDIEANGRGDSSASCRLGFGGEVGLIAWVAENVGFYAEAGYEWIDEASAKIGGAKAESDFSSLIVSAGLAIGF